MEQQIIEFNGITFRNHPNAKNRSDRVYFKASSNHYTEGIRYLHRYIWECEYGKVPKGYFIHHIDGNPMNNDISNLEMMDGREHASMHTKEYLKDHLEDARANMAKANKAACDWHKSEEGRAWHREHAKNSGFSVMPYKKYKCEFCGKEFESRKQGVVKFCHQNCKMKKYRREGRVK